MRENEADRDALHRGERTVQTSIKLFGQVIAPNWQPLPPAESSQQILGEQIQAQTESDDAIRSSKNKSRNKSNRSGLGKIRNGWYMKHSKEDAQRIRELIMRLHFATEWTDTFNEKARSMTAAERMLALDGDEALRSRLGPRKKRRAINTWKFVQANIGSFSLGQTSSSHPNHHDSALHRSNHQDDRA